MDNEKLEQRLTALETWRIVVDVSLGKNDIDRDYMKKEFSELKKELEGFKNTLSKLNYTIWGAVIIVFLKFAFSGQLAPFIN